MRISSLLPFIFALAAQTAMAGMMPPVIGDAERINAGHTSIQYGYDPCQDGRISDGHPHSCEEIRRIWRRGEGILERPSRRHAVHPCTDGSVTYGGPRTCGEIMDGISRNTEFDGRWGHAGGAHAPWEKK